VTATSTSSVFGDWEPPPPWRLQVAHRTIVRLPRHLVDQLEAELRGIGAQVLHPLNCGGYVLIVGRGDVPRLLASIREPS
jgi:hypothetical protein